MSIFVLGVDLGKRFCSLVGLDEEGAVVLRRTIRRSGLIKVIEKLAPKVAAMEACCGAHFVGRQCQALGIEVRLMPSVCVKTNKSRSRLTGIPASDWALDVALGSGHTGDARNVARPLRQ